MGAEQPPHAPADVSRRRFLVGAGALMVSGRAMATQEQPSIEPQPYFAGVARIVAAMQKLGSPLASADRTSISDYAKKKDQAAVERTEEILARYTLARVELHPDALVFAAAGMAQRTLIEQGWRPYLIRISNPQLSTDRVGVVFGNGRGAGAMSPFYGSLAQRPSLTPVQSLNAAPLVAKLWLLAEMFDDAPLMPSLSGTPIEYRVIQVFSRDRGERTSYFKFFLASEPPIERTLRRRGVDLTFHCLPSHDVLLRVLDSDGRGCMASHIIRDSREHIYPPQGMRLAPDMPFQAQIYRADGEAVRLPDGEYSIESWRGPEYLKTRQSVRIAPGKREIEVRLRRWIDPATYGWYSGDTHIHAAGCRHYEVPTAGVTPETMIRHVRGEALSMGHVLTWGPGYYYQRQFFSGRAVSPAASLEHPPLQIANSATLVPRETPKDTESLLRYDLEVSGFPSSHAGHLVLLRLSDQDYPGTKLIEDWPSWNLPILQWARAQGAVAGYAHCGMGMVVESSELPNYAIPPFDSIGTNEAIVDVTHDAVDFLSGCERPPAAELNAWYHLLNCGFRLAMVGETDFPCLSDERPGMGRTYVHLDQRPIGNEGFEAWIRSLKAGRLYCGDGRSHFLDFKVSGQSSGEQVALERAGTVAVDATIAAWLDPQPAKSLPYWHLEHARVGSTREVEVELIKNGRSIARRRIMADGRIERLSFTVSIERSSWLALRILTSSHTHPVFVEIAGRPVRASRRSAQWCRDCVDALWEVKSPFMRDAERPAALQAFEHARARYDSILEESVDE